MNSITRKLIGGVCAMVLSMTGASYAMAQPVMQLKQAQPSEALPTETQPKLINVLLGKEPIGTNSQTLHPSAGSTVPKVAILNPLFATDGDHEFEDNDANVTKILAGNENSQAADNGFSTWNDVYLAYDLGQIREIKEVKLYHNGYAAASSTFKNVKVEVATQSDFSDAVVLTEGDYVETQDTQYQPQIISANEQVSGRYLRVWQKGHFIENFNHGWHGYSNGVGFREIEVMSPALPGENVQPPAEEESRNIALHKEPYVYGLAPSNIDKISDGERDTGYARHNSLGRNWLQYEYRNLYKMSRIVLDLAPGNYAFINVSVLSSASDSHPRSVYQQYNVSVGDDPLTIDLPAGTKGKAVRFTVEKDASSPVDYREIEIWATGKNFDETPPEYTEPSSPYTELVWSDEFNGSTVDESKWNIIDGMANHAAIYNRGAVSIKDDGDQSCLALTSKNYSDTASLVKAVGWDKYEQGQVLDPKVTWSSGRVESKNKFSFQYGLMSVRAKPNDSQGIWPAIWMLAQDETGHDEIDVLEYLGQNPWQAWTTNHYGILGKNKSQIGNPAVGYEAWSQRFHVFDLIWSPERITWYIDGKYAFDTDRGKGAPLDGMHSRPMFPILETQVGDGWVGPVDYTKQHTKQDSDFLIDWIRVYQEPEHSVVRFDDFDWANPSESAGNAELGSYYVRPENPEGKFTYLSTGAADYENKNNFFYGGQPRYEDSRLALADGNEDRTLVYELPDIKDVHLTTYYRTIEGRNDTLLIGSWRAPHGHSIRENYTDSSIDFTMESSVDGKTWQPVTPHIVENFVEPHPSYSRTTFDGYGMPQGTRFIRIHFPDLVANGLKNTDAQLAKVTFLAGPEAAGKWGIPESSPTVDDASGVVPEWKIPDSFPTVDDASGVVPEWKIPDSFPTVDDVTGVVPEERHATPAEQTPQPPRLADPSAQTHKKKLANTGLGIGILLVLALSLPIVGIGLQRRYQHR